jgi:hypothetical protein
MAEVTSGLFCDEVIMAGISWLKCLHGHVLLDPQEAASGGAGALQEHQGRVPEAHVHRTGSSPRPLLQDLPGTGRQ